MSKNCIVRFDARPKATLRLFCIPYAGGSAHAFGPWAQSLPVEIDLLAIQLPGRGTRMFETPFTSLPSLIQEVSVAMLPYLDKPYVLFGHSMGAIVCLELARYFRTRAIPKPRHIVVSGSSAPRHRERTVFRSSLSDEQLIEELKSFSLNSSEVFNNAELMRIMLPTVRADFTVCETYVYQPAPLLESPITAFGGLDDSEVPRERLQLWEEETQERFSLHMFPGGHFYLHTASGLLLDMLVKELTPYLALKQNSPALAVHSRPYLPRT